jgi:hypothetical protein
LRHTYLTMLGRHGVDLRTAQELAGHSTPELTARYSHRRLYDLAEAVEKLPQLVQTSKPKAEDCLRMTGTDAAGLCSKPEPTRIKDLEAVAAVPPGVPTCDTGPHSLASDGIRPTICSTSDDLRQPL